MGFKRNKRFFGLLWMLIVGLLGTFMNGCSTKSQSESVLFMSFMQPDGENRNFVVLESVRKTTFDYDVKLEDGEMVLKIISPEGKSIYEKSFKGGEPQRGKGTVEGLEPNGEYKVEVQQNSKGKSSIQLRFDPKSVLFYKDKKKVELMQRLINKN